eukprot:scaffold3319_cov427-Prasinococcus_capsulatus_cf.AAC.25
MRTARCGMTHQACGERCRARSRACLLAGERSSSTTARYQIEARPRARRAALRACGSPTRHVTP